METKVVTVCGSHGEGNENFCIMLINVTWAAFVSSVSLREFQPENWLKYLSVPAYGNSHPARLSCYAGLGCLFSLYKHVWTNLLLRWVCFDSCPSLPLSCYSQTCPSACLAICTLWLWWTRVLWGTPDFDIVISSLPHLFLKEHSACVLCLLLMPPPPNSALIVQFYCHYHLSIWFLLGKWMSESLHGEKGTSISI